MDQASGPTCVTSPSLPGRKSVIRIKDHTNPFDVSFSNWYSLLSPQMGGSRQFIILAGTSATIGRSGHAVGPTTTCPLGCHAKGLEHEGRVIARGNALRDVERAEAPAGDHANRVGLLNAWGGRADLGHADDGAGRGIRPQGEGGTVMTSPRVLVQDPEGPALDGEGEGDELQCAVRACGAVIGARGADLSVADDGSAVRRDLQPATGGRVCIIGGEQARLPATRSVPVPVMSSVRSCRSRAEPALARNTSCLAAGRPGERALAALRRDLRGCGPGMQLRTSRYRVDAQRDNRAGAGGTG